MALGDEKSEVRTGPAEQENDARGRVRLPGSGGRLRPVVESIRPQVDGGRFASKAAVGDLVVVEADVFADGHDLLVCELRHQEEGSRRWTSTAMVPLGNDRWQGAFRVAVLGRYRFVIRADIDRYGSWHRDLRANAEAGKDISVDFAVGAELLEGAAGRARGVDGQILAAAAAALRRKPASLDEPLATDLVEWLGRDPDAKPTIGALLAEAPFAVLVGRYRAPGSSATSDSCVVVVEPERARFSTWYEMFPRSASPDSARSGTLADVEARLPYLSSLGIDVLYLPPIHPIGLTNRKGRNGSTRPRPDEPGSPWAIGASEGGHTALHPDLGTMGDFERLVAASAERGIDVAIDLAFQCSPDHPWVGQHPEWFRHLPDGTIRYAENPPKRYEDIYPIDFETENWEALWLELLRVVQFWINHGVTIFRVDNPHTKPFAFWEWLITSVKAEDPEVIFLSEAFTRPRIMQRLAKLGFSQSYTYFAWRTAKWELQDYLTELTRTAVADYFRPNFWPNTPDILTEQLQSGLPAVFVQRLVLAATLTASYGLYGPPFELLEHVPRHKGSEEYLDSEKYSLRHWDLDRTDSLAPLIGQLNAIRRTNPALQRNDTLRFHHVDNDQLIVYSKSHLIEHRSWELALPGEDDGPARTNVVLVAVNLDPHYTQAGWVHLDLGALGVDQEAEFVVRDLLTGNDYEWCGEKNYLQLDPAVQPAHVLLVEPAPEGRS